MRWQGYEPYIGPKTVLTYKEHYKCCSPYFGVPNVFQTIRNKVKGFDRITEYLNRTAKIEFTYEQDRPVVAFAPNIAKKYMAEKYNAERWWAYDYVFRMLKILELKPDEKLSSKNPPVVRVALDEEENLEKMRHLARYFGFEEFRMLTREKVKELKKRIR